MNIDKIKNKLNDNRVGIIGEYTDYGRFSVLIPIKNINNEPHILFEVRAMTLRNQPGEISLPGGRIEGGESTNDAAIRETWEEVGLKKDDIDIVGRTDILITQHYKIIYPYVGLIKDGARIVPSMDEVESIFYVPLKYFIENKPMEMKVNVETKPQEEFPYYDSSRPWEYSFSIGRTKMYFYKYDKYVIWGLTARIIKNFLEEIK